MIYLNNDSKLIYSGKWETFIKEGATIFSSAEKGAFVEFEFHGTSFIWYAHTNKCRGKASVYVDGEFMTNVDLYSLNEVLNVKAYSVENLPNKSHNVKIEVLGERNSSSLENKVTIQKIEISQEEIIEEIIEVEEIKVTEEVILKKGETLQLEWQVIPENATDKTVTFESGNTGFVSVTEEGLLTYINEGETNVSVKSSNGKVLYVKVICESSIEEDPIIPEQPTIPPSLNGEVDFSNAIDSTDLMNEGILIANEGCVMNIKDKEKIIAHILPYFWANTNPYILKSSNSEVIKINDGQVIEAVGAGNATITAYTIDGKYKHSINYEVAKEDEKEISSVYNLELSNFNIVANNNEEEVAINNSKGINQALQFCKENKIEKIVFPENELIYIEPKETIYMVSNLIVDLNKSELKLRANNYNTYSAIKFAEKDKLGVLENAKLCNGIITGERDEKGDVYPGWYKVGSTEGGVSILFNEGNNNGIENLTVRKSIGFNMTSGTGKESCDVAWFASYPIKYSDFEMGEFDQYGNSINNEKVIRTKNFMDISKVKGNHFDIGYPLGYHGYPYANNRIYDIYFYDKDKNFIERRRGLLMHRTYSRPKSSHYAKFVFHLGHIPTSGNTDFYGAVAFFENFNPPIKNYVKNCIIEDNYSCGFAICGGQKWIITDNIWRRNAGRMPGCDIDWEDGWEYMQGDLIENNSFESYNNCILCAGSGNVYNNNRFAGQSQFWGRSQYWTFTNNILQKGEYTPRATLSSSSDCYLANNKFIESNFVYGKNHSYGEYDCYSNNEIFEKSNVLKGTFKTVGSKFSLDCGFDSKEMEKCEITDKLDLNGNMNNCTIKKSSIRPIDNSNVIINNTELYNCSFDLSKNSKSVVFNNCKFVFEYAKYIIGLTSFAQSVEITFNNCIFEFKTVDEYYSLMGGWNCTDCTGICTFNKCVFKTEEGFKGYFTNYSWYPAKDNTKHITINFINTDASMFIPSPKETKSNIVIRR